MESIYLKTRIAELVDASTTPIVGHYRKQRSATTTNSEIVPFPKRKRRVSSNIWSTKHVSIPPFSQVMITVQTKREGIILETLEMLTGKLTEYRAAHKIQDIKPTLSICITVVDFTGGNRRFLKDK